MPFSFAEEIGSSVEALRRVFTSEFSAAMVPVAYRLAEALRGGGKILLMGNGGSAADAQHIAAELIGRFRVERPGLAAIALNTDTSVLTAWSNDYAYDTLFSRQVTALAQPGDVVWGISTSGQSANIAEAFRAARGRGAVTLGLLGRDGGCIAPLSDLSIIVPLTVTDQIQSAHRLIYHALCAYLDDAFRPVTHG